MINKAPSKPYSGTNLSWLRHIKNWAIACVALLLWSCDTKPVPLEFGKDVCAYCQMTLVDKKFGAELVNNKGKTVKFDSEECMLKYLKSNKDFKPTKFEVINYSNPGEMIDAEKAFYLIGGAVKSPMGGQLAAFKNQEDAKKFGAELKGNLVLWNKVFEVKI